MCSVVTSLATSLEIRPIMLYHFGRTQNGYVATQLILLSSTAESTVTSGYVVVPERFGQSGARAGRNVERTRKTERTENTTNCQSENTFDPETAEEYISQVSEEIEGGGGSLKDLPKNSTGRSRVFWVLYLNLTNFF